MRGKCLQVSDQTNSSEVLSVRVHERELPQALRELSGRLINGYSTIGSKRNSKEKVVSRWLCGGQ